MGTPLSGVNHSCGAGGRHAVYLRVYPRTPSKVLLLGVHGVYHTGSRLHSPPRRVQPHWVRLRCPRCLRRGCIYWHLKRSADVKATLDLIG